MTFQDRLVSFQSMKIGQFSWEVRRLQNTLKADYMNAKQKLDKIAKIQGSMQAIIDERFEFHEEHLNQIKQDVEDQKRIELEEIDE
jgi:hypothetical protein